MCLEASLSMSNRGMCYYHLGLVEQALHDLQAAESLGYPDEIKINKRRSLYTSRLAKMPKPRQLNRSPPKDPPYTVFLSQDSGRGLKATRTIKSGELIIADPAYVSLLELDRLDSFCYHCLRKIQHQQIFPCISCTQVRYCSMNCSREGFTVHRYECGYLDLIKENLSPNSAAKLLSMKIILSSDPSQVLSNDAIENNNLAPTNDYSNMMRLVDHECDGHILNREAAFLTSLIMSQHEGYKYLDPDCQLVLANKLLKHARQIKWNAMSISHRSLTSADFDPEVMDLREDLIGVGIFFTQLLINHSCDPNIQTCGFDGNRVYLQAIKNIDSGEEILNSYGMFSKWQPYDYRQSYLKENYNFCCNCSACRYRKEPLIRSYKCLAVNCNGPVVHQKCLLCSRLMTKEQELLIKQEIVSANRAISAGVKFLNEYLYEEEEDRNKFTIMERMFWDSYKRLRKHLYRDHRDVIMTMDTICSFYLRTNVTESKEAATDCAKRLLRDTRRVFDEDVHLFNTILKVMHCLSAFTPRVETEEVDDLKRIADEAQTLISKILPCESHEFQTLTDDILSLCTANGDEETNEL